MLTKTNVLIVGSVMLVAFFFWLRRLMEKGKEKEKERIKDLDYRKQRLKLIRTMLEKRPETVTADDPFWHTLRYPDGCIQHQRDGDYCTIVLRHSTGDITLFFINGALSQRFTHPLDGEEEFCMMAINDFLYRWEYAIVHS